MPFVEQEPALNTHLMRKAGASSRPSLLEAPAHLLGLVVVWLTLEFSGIFSPGLLDDVDSVYIESAREMLTRHDWVTPYIDGIRFFDKPPLLYWLAALSMRVFGVHDWAARLPLALLTLALFLAVYALGSRLFSPRGGFYAGLAIATCIGPYLYTRFFIPDVLLALWMTLGAHLLLHALSLLDQPVLDEGRLRLTCWAFAAVLALNVLTKGLIGLAFPLALVLLFLATTHRLRLLRRLHPWSSSLVFLLLAAPWHLLVAFRNPALPGSPGARGWFWFYIVNEHFMRFLGKRIPHDYGQVPLLLFFALTALWLAPWISFFPAAVSSSFRTLCASSPVKETTLLLLLWAAVVLGFFSLSSRQEYYSLPALPALALLIAGALVEAENNDARTLKWALVGSRWLLLPVALLLATVAGYFALTAPTPPPGADIASLLSSNPAMYNLSLGHIFDLTGQAMGLFRGPLAALSLAMLIGGPLSHFLRTRSRHLAANLSLAAAAVATLLCVHEGLVRFSPITGSRSLALAINHAFQPGDQILLDGEYTLGSSINFYTRQRVSVVEGRVNGLWYGSFWPDAPPIFETNDSLHKLWSANTRRLFLMTPNPARAADLARCGPVYPLAASGGKIVLSNRP